MAKLIIRFIILLLAVALGLFVHKNPGYVLVSVGNTHIQTTFWFAVIVLLLCYFILHQLMRIWRGTLSASGRYRRFVERRRQLKRQHAEAEQQKRQTYLDTMARIGQSRVLADLENYWQTLPKKYQRQPQFIASYSYYLIDQGQHAAAERLLVIALKQQWDAVLLVQYGRVISPDPAKQLARTEGWLAVHEADAHLLCCLGQICLHNQLWGKAKQYLEYSIQLQPSARAYQLLGEVTEKTEGALAALSYYKAGLQKCSE